MDIYSQPRLILYDNPESQPYQSQSLRGSHSTCLQMLSVQMGNEPPRCERDQGSGPRCTRGVGEVRCPLTGSDLVPNLNRLEKRPIQGRTSGPTRPVDYSDNKSGCHEQCAYSDAWYYVKAYDANGQYLGLMNMNSVARSSRMAPYQMTISSDREMELNRSHGDRSQWLKWENTDYLWKFLEVPASGERRYIMLNYGLYVEDMLPRDPQNHSRALPGGLPG